MLKVLRRLPHPYMHAPWHGPIAGARPPTPFLHTTPRCRAHSMPSLDGTACLPACACGLMVRMMMQHMLGPPACPSTLWRHPAKVLVPASTAAAPHAVTGGGARDLCIRQ